MTLLQQRNVLGVVAIVLVALLIWMFKNSYQHKKTAEQTIDELVVAIERSNNLVDKYNRHERGMINGFATNPAKQEKSLLWKPKQDSVFLFASRLREYINSLQNEIVAKAGIDMSSEEKAFKKTGNATVKEVMEKGFGNSLYDSLKLYAVNFYNIFPNDKRKSLDSLPFKLYPKTNKKEWLNRYAYNLSVKEAMAMLTKLNNDVNVMTNEMADFINQQFGCLDCDSYYDVFDVLVGQNSTCILLGETLQVTAAMGMYASWAKPIINIDGKNVALDAIGRGIYSKKITNSKNGSIPVSVSYKDPTTGKTKNITTNISYTVFHPPTK